MSLFCGLLVLFLLIQKYLVYFLKTSFLTASLIALSTVMVLAYILSKFLTQPIQEIIKTVRGLPDSNSKKEALRYSDDEWGRLLKTIYELDTQFESKIEEITKEKEYLQTVLKGMAEGVLAVDERGRILMVNDAILKLFSLPSNVIDKTPLELIRNVALEETMQEVIQDGKDRAFELILQFPLEKTFEVNVVALSTPRGNIDEEKRMRGAIAVFHDISRLKELEKIRQDFVANVSHELRTPLTTIKGYTETLLDGALKEEVAFQFVQVIKRQTDRLAKIVEDLLTLSKIESKEFQLKLENIPLLALTDDVWDFVRETAEKKKMTLFRGNISSSLVVKADRNYLEQILTNLLDNAIKYGREGGMVSISAFEKDRNEIQISVRDNGIGIPKQDLSRIFERFYRVDKGRSQELGGTGLGLAIVKHLVQGHGGKVWAESQLEEGSTFYFTLLLPSDGRGRE